MTNSESRNGKIRTSHDKLQEAGPEVAAGDDRYAPGRGRLEGARLSWVVDQLLRRADENDGFYDGSLDLLPWSFWVQELTDPHEDVERMVRVWNGDYLELHRYGEEPHDRALYTFRDGLGLAVLSISENMGFQYFRWFFTVEHLRAELARLGRPTEMTRGLPLAADIWNVDVPGDDLPELLSSARSVAMAYVSGDDYSDDVRSLVLCFRDLL